MLTLLQKDIDSGTIHDAGDRSRGLNLSLQTMHPSENIIEYNSTSKEFKIDHEIVLQRLRSLVQTEEGNNPFEEIEKTNLKEASLMNSVLFWSIPSEMLGNRVIIYSFCILFLLILSSPILSQMPSSPLRANSISVIFHE